MYGLLLTILGGALLLGSTTKAIRSNDTKKSIESGSNNIKKTIENGSNNTQKTIKNDSNNITKNEIVKESSYSTESNSMESDSMESDKMTRELTYSELQDIHYRWWSNKTTYEQKFIMQNDDYLRDLIREYFDENCTQTAACYISRIAASHHRFLPRYAENEMRKFLKK